MKYLPFGNTGLQVSHFCLGAMGFGSQLDRRESARVLDEALDHDVNIMDTAECYGESEAILGELLGARRENVIIATKVFSLRAADEHCGNNSRANILHSIEFSLRRLKTDYVDLYQLHHPDAQTPIEETLSTLDGLVKDGKVRYLGVTNHYAWQLAYMNGVAALRSWEPCVSLQTCYNIIDRPIEMEMVAFCERFNIAVMAYSPLCGGVLTGKYTRGVTPDPDSRVAQWGGNMLDVHESDQVHDILDALKQIAEETGVTINQLAIQWLLAKPYVTTVLLGGSRPEHFTPMYDVVGRPLDSDLVERMNALAKSTVYKDFRNQPVTHGPGRRSSN